MTQSSPLFTEARRCICRSVIGQLCPGGEWKGDDYWPTSPLRADAKPGSFHVTSAGLWKDFASDEGGDLIDLVVAIRGCSKVEAAEEIIRLGGGSIPDRERAKGTTKKPKAEAIIPIPAEGRTAITREAASAWARKRYGEPVKGWRYHNESGDFAFVVMRYDVPGGKQHTQYYWSADGVVNGIPPCYKTGRPLYRVHELIESPLPKLIVEGEKCADVQVPGHILTTWCGGSSSVERTDWSPLAKEAAPIIWPDADNHFNRQGRRLPDSLQPGIKAALAIQNRLPNAEILDVRKYAEGKDGWDIADAAAEGVDLVAFVRDCPRLRLMEEAGAKVPFSFLGYDTGRYHFLPHATRMPYAIDRGHFGPSPLQELAPLGWWADMGLIRDNGAIKTDAAQDWILSKQAKVGSVDLRRLRGAGVWRDGEAIVVNDGAQIVTMAGERLDYDEYKSIDGAEYIPSETHFGDMTGEESTDAEGAALAALFCSQSFARHIDPVALLGWALIAPFGGILSWRPHVWITGKTGTGKSQVIIELLVDPIIGDFAYKSTGRKTTEPGVRRNINMTARPVRIDEMEAKSKRDQERLASVLNLPILSAQDTSSVVSMASAGSEGTVTFVVRSCFLFASVNVPAEITQDAQAMNRFLFVEKLEVPDVRAEAERMARECEPVMCDPSRYRRRIFRALPRILTDIPRARSLLMDFIRDPRECDLLAPLLCAAWAVQQTESIESDAGRAWLAQYMDDIMRTHAERVEDEDRVVETLLEAQVRTDHGETRTVSELLLKAHDADSAAVDLLARNGMRITDLRNCDGLMHRYLAVAQHSEAVSRMLSGTPYATGYESQLRRHPMCKDGEVSVVRIAGKCTRCRLLEWVEFRDKYLADGGGRLEGME